MKRLIFYITGHGFGHATRIIDVINQLCSNRIDVMPVIATSVPKWLFDQQLAAKFEYLECENSIGAIQKDFRSVDKLETLKRYSEFIKVEPAFVDSQVDFIKRNDVRAVIADIPSVVFMIADKAKLPSFAITNFSWDWIYEPYVRDYPQYEFVLDHIRSQYALADCLLRLPFYGDLSAFPVIEDIPLIATCSQAERQNVFDHLDIPQDKKLVLMYLGEFDYSRVLSNEILRRKEYYFMKPEEFRACELPFQDLLNAADVVLTKPGYGMVSECIANRTAIMYTEREDFVEYFPLVEGIKQYAKNRFISEADLLNGTWLQNLDELIRTDYIWPPIPINGSEIAAEKIMKAI